MSAGLELTLVCHSLEHEGGERRRGRRREGREEGGRERGERKGERREEGRKKRRGERGKGEEEKGGKFDEQLHYDRKVSGRLSTRPGSHGNTC